MLLLLLASLASAFVIEPRVTNDLPNKALIIINGGNVAPTHYSRLANDLVKTADSWGFNLFVSVPNTMIPNWPDPLSLPGTIERAVADLQKYVKLDPKKDVFIAGHSLGGIVMKSVKNKYAGFLFYASYLEVAEARDPEWTTPSLQISGTRDGFTRITKMAALLQDYIGYYLERPEVKNRYPIIFVNDMTHSQFTDIIKIENPGLGPDLDPVIFLQDALSKIAEASLAFIAHLSNTSNEALPVLQTLVDQSMDMIQPYVHALYTDVEALCRQTQQELSPFATEFNIAVKRHSNPISFAMSKPKMEDGRILVQAFVSKKTHFPPGRVDRMYSPDTILCKMVSNEAISSKLNMSAVVGGSCANMQDRLIQEVMSSLSLDQMHLYTDSGAVLQTAPSVMASTGFDWLRTPLRVQKQPHIANLTLVELAVPLTSKIFPGNHYCKLYHPAAIWEYAMLDSFIN